MHNNAAEQSIRGFCIGKKNWVMIDTVAGAKSSAIIYSIAETAKANNLKPYEYFEYLLTKSRSIWMIRIIVFAKLCCPGHRLCRGDAASIQEAASLPKNNL